MATGFDVPDEGGIAKVQPFGYSTATPPFAELAHPCTSGGGARNRGKYWPGVKR